MTHTAKDIDNRARIEVMSRRLSDEEAVDPFSLDEARRMRGSGWEGDLDEMRAGEFLT